jgi:hypothetical protein
MFIVVTTLKSIKDEDMMDYQDALERCGYGSFCYPYRLGEDREMICQVADYESGTRLVSELRACGLQASIEEASIEETDNA